MLRACQRVLKPGAPLAFFVVTIADGLSRHGVERAIEAGPEYVEAGPGYRALVEEAGFAAVEIVDVSDEYAATLSDSIRARDAEAAELKELVGADVFAEGQASRREELAAVHNRLLRRHLISAVRPQPGLPSA